MKRKSYIYSWLAVLLLVSVVLGIQRLETFGKNPEDNPELDLYYIPDTNYLRVASLGFDAFVADIYWIRTVLYFGRRYERNIDDEYISIHLSGRGKDTPDYITWQNEARTRFRYLYELINTVTDLDPYFLVPYSFGGLFLSMNANMPDLSVQLLNKGLDFLPERWEIPYLLGFNYFIYLDDSLKSAQYFMRAAELPGCPHDIIGLANKILLNTGKRDVAIEFISGIKNRTNDPELKERMERILENLENMSDVPDRRKRGNPSGRTMSGS